jgi:hypothetical protein
MKLEEQLQLLKEELKKELQLNKYKFINSNVNSKTIHDINKAIENVLKELRKNKKCTNKEKQNIITRLISTEEGRRRLAESMAQPLRDRMDYQSVARQIFRIQPMSKPIGSIFFQKYKYGNTKQ